VCRPVLGFGVGVGWAGVVVGESESVVVCHAVWGSGVGWMGLVGGVVGRLPRLRLGRAWAVGEERGRAFARPRGLVIHVN
jgi:hypothetical protein